MNRKMINRRDFFGFGSISLGVASAAFCFLPGITVRASVGEFEIVKTEAEWKQILTPDQFAVMRKDATERRYSSPLLKEKRQGTYHCAACDLPVYSSRAKYDSKTGWPSFFESIIKAVGTRPDDTFFTRRTEVHCRRCGGHFGHIFNDGPPPTGKRHCINGLALNFKPKSI